MSFFLCLPAGVILETEGRVQKIQKRALFRYKTVKQGIPDLTSPYIHGLFIAALIKQIPEENKSSRAVSRNWTQFKPEINPDPLILIVKNSLKVLLVSIRHSKNSHHC